MGLKRIRQSAITLFCRQFVLICRHQHAGRNLRCSAPGWLGDQKWTLGMDILKDVKQIISKQVGVPLEQLSPESRLEAIGVESLDVIEIIFALEKKYDVAIPFNANESAAL